MKKYSWKVPATVGSESCDGWFAVVELANNVCFYSLGTHRFILMGSLATRLLFYFLLLTSLRPLCSVHYPRWVKFSSAILLVEPLTSRPHQYKAAQEKDSSLSRLFLKYPTPIIWPGTLRLLMPGLLAAWHRLGRSSRSSGAVINAQ